MQILRHLLSLGLIVTTGAMPVVGCDLCGCYTPQLETTTAGAALGGAGAPAWTGGLLGAVSEQFTHFETVQIDGREVPNTTDQHLDSSITQLVGGYRFDSRFAVQVNVPLIYRSFSRPEGFAIDHGTESGLGDVSVLGKLVLWHHESEATRAVTFDDPKNPRMETHEPDLTFSAVLLGGAKFPTGDSSRIREEFNETEVEGAPVSGIHGHDLTLGTGSYDGIFGGQTSLRYKNFFFDSSVQFTLRGDGLHQYHFANDLSWDGGPGYYFVRRPGAVVGLQAVLSGEYKDVDRFQGEAADDTGITAVYAGPRIVASLGRFSAEVAVALPVSIQNTALQVVPDYRINGAIAVHF